MAEDSAEVAVPPEVGEVHFHMRCPRCRTRDLKEVKLKKTGVRIDGCPGCRGAWFDAGELDSVLEVAAKELKAPSDSEESEMLCPTCQRALYAFHYPQTLVTIDMCKKCGGLWVDSGEYAEIKLVRKSLRRRGKLEEYAPPTGVKGALLRFMDTAMEALHPD